MGTYDDERSGKYDNSYNRNFYKTTDRRGYNNENINKKVDSIIDEMDKKIKEEPFLDKIYFLMEVVHNNIVYDEKLRDFTLKKETGMGIFKNFYDYKNSAKEVIKNKKGTCVGFSNTLKTLCEGAGIECKIMFYKNNSKNMNHQLNTVFDNDKKYYVDPTWGFIVDSLDELKAIYRGEKPNPRINQTIGWAFKNQKINHETSISEEVDGMVKKMNEKEESIKSFTMIQWLIIIIAIVIIMGILSRL